MGQKVSPVGLRVGVNRNWDSRWYANDQDFAGLLHEDIKVRDYILKKLKTASVAKVEIERSKNLFQNFMDELEKDIDLTGVLQNEKIKEEYRFLDFKGSPADRIKKYAPLIKEEIIRMQDYSTDTEEYSAAWDKMNFLLDKYTQAVGELVPFSEDELSTPCVCKNQEDVLKQINELMDYSMEQDISENNLKISEKLTLIYPLGILLLGL